ncbi:unnamed protein product [Cladocopium goreaui]|uniref:GH18 domain-containing protein n=1 Tax=Cladocopium goreaui TaxID=2562237 RepID=A0A9P1CHF0_9DINO|nr:unnamed protein product [Cladocopium goreaui]
MFDLETNSGGCRAAIAAGRSSACGASSGTDYGTSPSADMFVQAYKAVQALGKGVAVSWSYQMPYCMDNSAEIVNTATVRGQSNLAFETRQAANLQAVNMHRRYGTETAKWPIRTTRT